MKSIVCGRYGSKEEFHRFIAGALSFPAYYGENLDALADCLGEVCEPTEIVLAKDFAIAGDVDYASTVREVFFDVAEENAQLRVKEEKA